MGMRIQEEEISSENFPSGDCIVGGEDQDNGNTLKGKNFKFKPSDLHKPLALPHLPPKISKTYDLHWLSVSVLERNQGKGTMIHISINLRHTKENNKRDKIKDREFLINKKLEREVCTYWKECLSFHPTQKGREDIANNIISIAK